MIIIFTDKDLEELSKDERLTGKQKFSDEIIQVFKNEYFKLRMQETRLIYEIIKACILKN